MCKSCGNLKANHSNEKKSLTKTKAIEHMKSGAKKLGKRVKGSNDMTYIGK